ncbi:uroporphyrinogen-III synthase [Legionella yabuuchiae]|uniref:uroporphyrinogen-III synthase n=1 Tax=Legionella yabuuchiae TaxID=376727 RepID=UPI00105532F6|nr:uroporphyrinogen-III synthase [Legionella yabuuchiae]
MSDLTPIRVLNTRPKGQNAELSQLIQSVGCQSIELPAITITPLNQWLSKLPSLSSIDYSIFISTNAVNLFFDRLDQHHMTWPSAIQVVAIGHATAKALHKRGVKVIAVPNPENSEGLLKLPQILNVNDKHILQVKGEGGLELIQNTLKARGANVTPIEVYQRALPSYSQSKINSLWHEDAVDIILFTSQETVQNLFAIFGNQGQSWLREKPCLVISERIAVTAKALGMKTIVTCSYATLGKTLLNVCESKNLKK